MRLGGRPRERLLRPLAARLLAFSALLVCPALAACGGSDTDRPAPDPPRLSDAEQVAATVRRQMQAVARGDGETACALFSPAALEEARDLVSRRAGDIGCVTAVEQAAGSLPGDVRAALRRPAITQVEVRGDRATVKVRLPAGVTALAGRVGRAGDGTPLRRIDGRWRVAGLRL